MKKLAIALCAAAAVLVSCEPKQTKGAHLLENYAQVTVPAPDLSGITDNGKEVLNLYRFAADQADEIYWNQVFGSKDVFDNLADPAERSFAYVNYGPWNRIDNKPFIEGYGERPAGACFYPEDMTKEEFEALEDPAKDSPYTLIRRAQDGSLEVVWYHDAYSTQVGKIASFLRAAADITIKSSVREYLLKMADAVLTDNYYESEKAWLNMDDSKMDLVIGPTEAIDDQLYGLKASYGAYVLLKNLSRTETLQMLCTQLPELQAMLPGDPSFHSFVPGIDSDIFSCDVIYYGGYPNAGYKNIAINLPHDERAQKEMGTRTILFDNIIRDKFNRTLFPVGRVLFDSEDAAHIDANAFYYGIVYRELAKSLGVKETINGQGLVADALGSESLTIEKAKSNVIGAYLNALEVNKRHLDALILREDVLATFVANTIRSCRFGDGDATGRAAFIVYNYLVEQGAIFRKASGKYDLDYDKIFASLEKLGASILEIQATGDKAAANELVAKYGHVSSTAKADIVSLELEKVPADIRVVFEK